MMDEILLFLAGMLAGYYLKTLLFAGKTAWFVENLEDYRKELGGFYEQNNEVISALNRVLEGLHRAGIIQFVPNESERKDEAA